MKLWNIFFSLLSLGYLMLHTRNHRRNHGTPTTINEMRIFAFQFHQMGYVDISEELQGNGVYMRATYLGYRTRLIKLHGPPWMILPAPVMNWLSVPSLCVGLVNLNRSCLLFDTLGLFDWQRLVDQSRKHVITCIYELCDPDLIPSPALRKYILQKRC